MTQTLFSTQDICKALDCSKQVVSQWVKNGQLVPTFKGKMFLYERKEFDRIIEKKKHSVQAFKTRGIL